MTSDQVAAGNPKVRPVYISERRAIKRKEMKTRNEASLDYPDTCYWEASGSEPKHLSSEEW
jgi:hypothetical protein